MKSSHETQNSDGIPWQVQKSRRSASPFVVVVQQLPFTVGGRVDFRYRRLSTLWLCFQRNTKKGRYWRLSFGLVDGAIPVVRWFCTTPLANPTGMLLVVVQMAFRIFHLSPFRVWRWDLKFSSRWAMFCRLPDSMSDRDSDYSYLKKNESNNFQMRKGFAWLTAYRQEIIGSMWRNRTQRRQDLSYGIQISQAAPLVVGKE
jgi:hypothetical protein